MADDCCPVRLDGCSKNCGEPYPFHPHERRYQRKALPGSKDAQYSTLQLNGFPLVVAINTQTLNMGYRPLCGLVSVVTQGQKSR